MSKWVNEGMSELGKEWMSVMMKWVNDWRWKSEEVNEWMSGWVSNEWNEWMGELMNELMMVKGLKFIFISCDEWWWLVGMRWEWWCLNMNINDGDDIKLFWLLWLKMI